MCHSDRIFVKIKKGGISKKGAVRSFNKAYCIRFQVSQVQMVVKMVDVHYVLAWTGVYFCRDVLIVNGIV